MVMRRYGEAVKAGIRYTHRPGAYAVLIRRGQVLLTHQDAPVPEFQLPGGGIDRGEQVLPALHREILEETGWHVSGLRRLTAVRRFVYMPEYSIWAEKICTVYIARPTRRVGPPLEPDHLALTLPVRTAIEVLGNDGDRHFLKAYAGG